METAAVSRERAPNVAHLLARIEARLDRIERTLAPIEKLAHDAPALAATVGDIGDEIAARLGNTEQRVQALGDLAERLTRPDTLRTLGHVVDVIESAPNLVATATDTADELIAQAAEEGLDLTHVVDDTKRLFIGLLKLMTSPQLRALLDSGMLDPQVLTTLGIVARSVADANEVEPPQVGIFGAMKRLRDGDTQRALGFVLRVAEGVGRRLRRENKRRGAGEGRGS